MPRTDMKVFDKWWVVDVVVCDGGCCAQRLLVVAVAINLIIQHKLRPS